MRSKKALVPFIMLAAVLAGACADQGPGDSRLSAAEAAFIALDTDALAGDMILGHIMLFGGMGFDADVGAADERTFSRSRECPAGGSVSVEGTASRTRGDGMIEWNFNTTGAWSACAHARGDVTITKTGTWEQTAYRKIVRGDFAGVQTSTKRGSFEWSKSTGESGTCAFDVTSTRNAETGTRTVKGTVCGREIDREVTWRRGDG